MNKIILVTGLVIAFTSCTGPKIKSLEEQLADKKEQIGQLQQQLIHTQQTNTSLLETMADLSVINKTEAQSIQQSLEALTQQTAFVRELTSRIHEKDSLNLALVTNLKRSLLDMDDDDIYVEVRGSAVYVSIADRMLFETGSSRISTGALTVLEKVARVINDHDQLNILVEGHTDNVPISNDRITDNWDLSVLRATAVVRALQVRFGVNPVRMTAAGRSQYLPKSDNQSTYGRSLNRRTEIIITPKLDQFFELLKRPALIG